MANGTSNRPKIAILTEITVDYCFSKLNCENVENLLRELDCYEIYKITVRGNKWTHAGKDGREVEVDKNDFSLTIDGKKIKFDAALNIIDDSDGKNANIQGYLEIMNIPTPNAGLLSSALAFDKVLTNRLVSTLSVVKVPKSVKFTKNCPHSLNEVKEKLRFPVIVKPVAGTNSYGVIKVEFFKYLEDAIERDFEICTRVLIEEFIPGRELTCAAYKTKNQVHILGITERISKISDFFDYETKKNDLYEQITPAKIPDRVAKQVEVAVKTIYKELDYKGLIRCDFRLEDKTDELYFLEVNSFPVLSKSGVVMHQCKAAGISLGGILCEMLEECMLNSVNW